MSNKTTFASDLIKSTEKQLLDLRGALYLLKKMHTVSEFFEKPKSLELASCLIGNEIWIKAFSVEALENARKALRSLFPNQAYSDACTSVYSVGNQANAWYTVKIDNKRIPVSIELIMPVENFPTLKEGCGFKKKTIKAPATEHETWVYACEANA